MIRRIIEHNELNGVVFSTIEFILVAATAAFIAAGMARQGNMAAAVLAAGTMLNSLVIVAFGVRAWRRGERGMPLGRVFSPAGRAEITRQHPRLMEDTVAVATAALIPFALLLIAVVEFSRRRQL